jgi:hypothetical protein
MNQKKRRRGFQIERQGTKHALHNIENSKQIFPGKELRGYSPNSNIHVSGRDLYISLIGLPILLLLKLGLRPRYSFTGNT